MSIKEFRLDRKSIGAHCLKGLWGPGPTGSAGKAWLDMSVRRNDGVLTNMDLVTDCVADPERGWVLDFATDQSVQVSNFMTTGDYSSYSITAWVKATWLPGDAMAIVDNSIALGSGFRFYRYAETFLKLSNDFLFLSAGAVGVTVLPSGEWLHVAGTSHNTGATSFCAVYLNGRLDGWNATVENYVQNGSNLGIGYRPTGGTSSITAFNGRMHDVRIYNRALTGPQITHMYNATRYHPYADILLRPTRRYVHRHRGALEAD